MTAQYVLALLPLIPLGLASSRLAAQALPSDVKQILQQELRFSVDEVASAEAGNAVARIIETGDPEDIFIAGVVRIASTPAAFVSRYKDITRFESSPSVHGSAKFSRPPQDKDIAGLSISRNEVDSLRECEPGDCDFKMGAEALRRLRSSVKWDAPDYVQQANRVVRQLWVEYVRNYQARGDSALASYIDTDKPFPIEAGLSQLLGKTAFLQRTDPELVNYLKNYPKAKLAGSEEFFYWQQADFGLKPVHRATHVVIQRKKGPTGPGAIIASKMLFANHYFRSALEFRILTPATGSSSSKPSTYLLVLQRSYVDGLGGFTGRLIRGPILSRTKDSLERYLLSVKSRLESGK